MLHTNYEVQAEATAPTADPNLNSNAQDIQDPASTPRSTSSITQSLFREISLSSEDLSDSDSFVASTYTYRFKTSSSCIGDYENAGRGQSHAVRGQQEIRSTGRQKRTSHGVSNAYQKPCIRRALSETCATLDTSTFTIEKPNPHNPSSGSVNTPSKPVVRPRTAPDHGKPFSTAGSMEVCSAQMHRMSLTDESHGCELPKNM
jgi:hypothetical protein